MTKLDFENWRQKATVRTGIFKKEEITQLVVDRALKDILEKINYLLEEVERLKNGTS